MPVQEPKVVVVEDEKVVVVTERNDGQITVITAGFQGLPGARGKTAYEIAVAEGFQGTQEEWLASIEAARISADPGNAARPGSDNGVFVPDDITADPLAYYILARS